MRSWMSPFKSRMKTKKRGEKYGNIGAGRPADRKGEYYQMLYDFLNAGFSEIRIDGQFMSLRERIELSRYKQHTIDLVVDRLPAGVDFTDKDKRLRLAEAIESALKYGHDVVTLITDKGNFAFGPIHLPRRRLFFSGNRTPALFFQ